MFKISFNNTLISTTQVEKDAIGLALNLHNVSNIPHNISVTKDDVEVMYFVQR